MTEEEMSVKRFKELAQKAYAGNYYTNTGFLSLGEMSLLKGLFITDKDLSGLKYELYGGAPDCERCIAVFGDKEALAYDFEYPIVCVKISPKMQKFAEKLAHRDILGSVLNLGFTRSNIGDIIIKDNVAFMFVLDTMADYIVRNLERVRHTPVKADIVSLENEDIDVSVTKNELEVMVPSLRIDVLISKVHKLSRNAATALIKGGKLFINGMACENSSRVCKEGDLVTLRGYGRFEYIETLKETKKGNLLVLINVWK